MCKKRGQGPRDLKMFESQGAMDRPGHYSRKRSSSKEDRFSKRPRDNRNSYNRGDPYKLDYLVNLKQFQEYFLRNSRKETDEEEMLKRFQVYKENFTRKQNEKFFLKFKDSEWFRNKYHPDECLKKDFRANLSREFEIALKNGEYDSVSFEANASGVVQLPLKKSLFITKIPDYVKISELEEVLKQKSGFKELVLSDPRIDKSMTRVGWVYFEEEVDLEQVCKELDNFKVGNYSIHLVINNAQELKVGVLPKEMSVIARVKVDLEQAKKLAKTLDQAVGISQESGVAIIDQWVESDDNEEKKMHKYLDLIIYYLMKVHQYDYYGGVETDSIEAFCRKVIILLRPVGDENVSLDNETFTSEIDSRIDLLINLQNLTDEKITQLGGRSLTRVLDSFLASYIKKESETKYRCVECQKLFKGDEYVKKHLKTKHPELVKTITTDTLMFNAYMLDQNKIDPVKNTPARDRVDSYNSGSRSRDSSRYDGPPKTSGRSDPRQIRSYEDLDAPVDGDVELQYD